jgi:hypothetical protein
MDDPIRDEHPVPPRQCIDQYYDSHNWLAFKNSCNVTLKVAYLWATGRSTIPSIKTLKGGQSDSTGHSKDEVDSKGGAVLAICLDGFHPVDGDGKFWTNPRAPYTCKKD